MEYTRDLVAHHCQNGLPHFPPQHLSKPGAAACPGGETFWTLLLHTPFPLKSIYLMMFKNTQPKVWGTATCCPSLSPVCITEHEAMGKAATVRWGVQGWRTASLRKNTDSSLAAAGFVFTVSPEFLAEEQCEPYSVLWFNIVFIEFSTVKAGLKLSPLTWSHDWGPVILQCLASEVISLIPRQACDRDCHFNLFIIYECSESKQQQEGVVKGLSVLWTLKERERMNKIQMFGYQSIPLCSSSSFQDLSGGSGALYSGDSKGTAGSQADDKSCDLFVHSVTEEKELR